VVLTLAEILKPFYMSTMLLQTQKYHTLSIGKIIENMLIKYFEKKQIDSNSSEIEKELSNCLLESIKKYLFTKISSKQKDFMLVCETLK
jgi:uncharacterized protein YdaL